MDDMSKISAKDINDTHNLQTKASFSFEVVHALKTDLQSGMRLCIMPGLPTHLVQELNIRTVFFFIDNLLASMESIHEEGCFF